MPSDFSWLCSDLRSSVQPSHSSLQTFILLTTLMKTTLMHVPRTFVDLLYTNATSANALVTTREFRNARDSPKRSREFPGRPPDFPALLRKPRFPLGRPWRSQSWDPGLQNHHPPNLTLSILTRLCLRTPFCWPLLHPKGTLLGGSGKFLWKESF